MKISKNKTAGIIGASKNAIHSRVLSTDMLIYLQPLIMP